MCVQAFDVRWPKCNATTSRFLHVCTCYKCGVHSILFVTNEFTLDTPASKINHTRNVSCHIATGLGGYNLCGEIQTHPNAKVGSHAEAGVINIII